MSVTCVVMLEVIINKFLWFAPVLIVLISSFAFSFYMLLQKQLPFQTVGFAWLRSAFMLTDVSYEGRLYGPKDENLGILYPVVIALFICYGVAIFILVTNLLIGLAVGEIPTLLQVSRLQTLIIRYEFLNSSEIFRLQYICAPSKIYLNEEITEPVGNDGCISRLKWFRQHAFFRPSHHIDDNDED